MSHTPVAATTTGISRAPVSVRLSVAGWLTAIAAGAAEALVRATLPGPPTSGQLAGRCAIYAILAAVVLALLTGRDVIRWFVAVLLGGIGTVSLVVEPLRWLADGGSPASFLTAAAPSTLVMAGLRLAHLIAVLTALVLMFRPSAHAFFRSHRTSQYT